MYTVTSACFESPRQSTILSFYWLSAFLLPTQQIIDQLTNAITGCYRSDTSYVPCNLDITMP